MGKDAVGTDEGAVFGQRMGGDEQIHRRQRFAQRFKLRAQWPVSHPLGEHVVDEAKRPGAPPARVVFDVTNHPARIHVVEALKGRSGYLTLTRLAVDSFECEEHLLFSGFDESGRALDQETIEKLFGCSARVEEDIGLSGEITGRLEAESKRHVNATVSRSLAQNSKHFNDAREKLEKWADDMVLAAEKALKDTKEQNQGPAPSGPSGGHAG